MLRLGIRVESPGFGKVRETRLLALALINLTSSTSTELQEQIQ